MVNNTFLWKIYYQNTFDEVIAKLGMMAKEEIVAFMHKESAYTNTKPREVILFKYAVYLQI